ncbi:Protein NRT1/ PTR FAMILY 5 [Arachis hypogaea]|nr:Protein NRT1/ PTR FAMILY 5 [Arachis hypogaea]
MATPAFFWLVVKAKIAKKINKMAIIYFGAKRKIIDSTTMKIGIGIFLAVICCVFAWKVENHRLYSIGMMNTKALIPQFLLLGMAEALVEDGLSQLFEIYASESVRNFAEPFSNIVIGIGKLLSIPWFLMFSCWINESINTSHLDRYFLMLAILNFVLLLFVLVYYYMFGNDHDFLEDEEEMMEQISEDHGLESDLEEANGLERNSTTSQGPEIPNEDKEIEMERLGHNHEIDSPEEHAKEEHLTVIFEGDFDHQNNGVLVAVVESNEP